MEKGKGKEKKGKGIKGKTEVEFDTEDQVLFCFGLTRRSSKVAQNISSRPYLTLTLHVFNKLKI